jgi:hypothetical protein
MEDRWNDREYKVIVKYSRNRNVVVHLNIFIYIFWGISFDIFIDRGDVGKKMQKSGSQAQSFIGAVDQGTSSTLRQDEDRWSNAGHSTWI